MSLSLEKGLKLLLAIADRHDADAPGASLKDVAAAAALDKATAHRLLRSLAKYQLVEQDANGHYELGIGALTLSQAAFDANRLLRRVLPVMRSLNERTDETISLAERRGDASVTVHEIPSSQVIRYTNRIGVVSPLHVGAGCRATLAYCPPEIRESVLAGALPAVTGNSITDRARLETVLATVRADGYATSAGERVSGTVGVAVPLLGRNGYSVGSLSILWPSRGEQTDAERRARWPQLMLDAVRELQGTL